MGMTDANLMARGNHTGKQAMNTIAGLENRFNTLNNTVTDYRSNFEEDGFVYSGFLLNFVIIIKRCNAAGVEEYAQSLTDLETDWTNRLSLTYV